MYRLKKRRGLSLGIFIDAHVTVLTVDVYRVARSEAKYCSWKNGSL